MSLDLLSLTDDILVKIFVSIPPQNIYPVCKLFNSALTSNIKIFWHLQYQRLGYQIPLILEEIKNPFKLYLFLDKQDQIYNIVLPSNPHHLSIILKYFSDYIDPEILKQKIIESVKISDINFLRMVNYIPTSDEYITIIENDTSNVNQLSIISALCIKFRSEQLSKIKSSDTIAYLIKNNLVTDIDCNDSLFEEYIHDPKIIHSLLYQNLNPSYNNNILVKKIFNKEVYALLRDDCRLELDAHDEILIQNFRDDTDIVVELLERGFEMKEDLLRYFISNKLSDLKLLSTYLNKEESLYDLINDEISQHDIKFEEIDFNDIRDLAEYVSDTNHEIIQIFNYDDAERLVKSSHNLNPFIQFVNKYPRFFLCVIYPLVGSLLMLTPKLLCNIILYFVKNALFTIFMNTINIFFILVIYLECERINFSERLIGKYTPRLSKYSINTIDKIIMISSLTISMVSWMTQHNIHS